MTNAVIFDVDGTLCDVQGIRHYVREERNFDLFHRASLFCPPIPEVVALTHSLDPRVKRIVVTARQNRYEDVTKMWLQKHNVRYDRLYMRAWDDTRKDYTVKREILAQIRSDGFVPVFAVDDNPQVIRLWKQEGIPVMEIPGFD